MKISRTLPRSPGPEVPSDPRCGPMWLVRYVDVNGQTVSVTFFHQDAAWKLQDWVNRAGGHANVFKTEVEWRLMG